MQRFPLCQAIAAFFLLGLCPVTARADEQDPSAEPPSEPPAESPPQDPPQEDWGVGGTEEEGKFAPKGKTGAKKREEEQKAQEDKPEDLRVIPPRDAGVEMLIGFGKIRDVRNDAAPTSATVVSLLPYFNWRVAEMWTIGARLPISWGALDGPSGDGDNFTLWTLGNVEVSVQATVKLRRSLRLPISLALTVPTGQGDMFPEQLNAGARPQAVINQAAMSARGWEDQSLFNPRRFALVPAVGVTYDTRVLHFAAGTKFELMIRAGGGTPAAEVDGTLHNPAYNWVTGASFFYDFLDGRVSPGLRAWLAVSRLPVSVRSIDYSGAQFVLEPEVMSTVPIRENLAVRGGIGFILPVAGPLGGANGANIYGLRLRAGVAF